MFVKKIILIKNIIVKPTASSLCAESKKPPEGGLLGIFKALWYKYMHISIVLSA